MVKQNHEVSNKLSSRTNLLMIMIIVVVGVIYSNPEQTKQTKQTKEEEISWGLTDIK